MNPEPDLAHDNARLGALFLDLIEPNWYRQVQLDKLDESFVFGDVSHWVFGNEASERGYKSGFDLMNAQFRSQAADFVSQHDGVGEGPFEALGFDQSIDLGDGQLGYLVTYRDLTLAWRDQVMTRWVAARVAWD